MRVLKIAGGAVAVVIVIVALLLVAGIPSDLLSSAIAERVERETGYRLTVAGSTKVGLWPSLNVTLTDVTLDKPSDRETSLTVGSIQADTTLASLWAGHPEITELAIVRPVLNVPLLRERSAAPRPASSKPAAVSGEPGSNAPAIQRIKVSDATIVFSNLRDRVEDRIEGLNADAMVGADRKIRISGSARAGEHPLKFDIKATAPAPPLERQNVPVELTLDAPDLLQAPLSGRAEVRLNGSVVMINGLAGTVGDGAFNGWASVDLASKPLVKLDLDFQRLDIAVANAPAASRGSQDSQRDSQKDSQASQPSQQPWSNASLGVHGLNYVDAQIKVSAAELNIGEGHFAPVAIDATLNNGALKCGITNLGAYGGQASGELDIDVSGSNPAYALRSDLAGVRALPLLRSAAGFDKLDGKLQAKIAVRSTGASQRAIMSNLNGTVFAVFQDGAIRGLNVAQMIRSLTATTLSGWQESREQSTDLTQLSASFRIEQGQATTGDLNLVGPLVKMTGTGTVDLGNKSLAFRVEPKLVMTTEGQGRAADPVGFGIPVVIDGPWAEPRIYPDMAGMLDNPDAAYAKLKEMGKGLFGPGGPGSGLGGLIGGGSDGSAGGGGLSDQLGGKLGETLGNLLQQGLGQSRGQSRGMPATSPPPAPSAPPQSDPPTQQQESQPMNDVLKQLFNR
jgi:AsmA protein